MNGKQIAQSSLALARLGKACEQMEPMSPEELRAWQARMGLTGRAAARLLGMSPPAYLDRANGRSHTTGKPVGVSRTMTLACVALEVAKMAEPQIEICNPKK
ncbi:hypothetical protein E4O93_05385 [Diaphorobacter sp. DS2]|nr:hypothetical protein E4O93_05385 [Diaphorobacter sp. DS2]